MTVGLHIYSTASGIRYTPSGLVKPAKNQGIEALALTNRYTIGGIDEAQRTGGVLGL